MKKVLVVRGSHDGNLGVYTNVKLAYERCLEYLDGYKVQTSYREVLKSCKSWGSMIYTDAYDMSCEIQVFYLNE